MFASSRLIAAHPLNIAQSRLGNVTRNHKLSRRGPRRLPAQLRISNILPPKIHKNALCFKNCVSPRLYNFFLSSPFSSSISPASGIRRE